MARSIDRSRDFFSRKSLVTSINAFNEDLPNSQSFCRQSPSSVETISGEDDIVEVPMDESSKKEQEEMREKYHAELLSRELYLEEMFLLNLQLMATKKALELQNKRAERKRRSTANSQFVYSMTDQPAVSIYIGVSFVRRAKVSDQYSSVYSNARFRSGRRK